jgi:heme/copper-type cytochrome/quinol oxidase subunit 4
MSEFHDPFPNYEVLAQHDEAYGKKARKKLWVVFWILLVVTIVEVIIGLYAAANNVPTIYLKVIFIGLTIVKAFYIVYKFMHLGHEERWTKWMIIAPFTGFILYFIFMLTIGEGNYSKSRRFDAPVAETEESAPAPAGVKH